MNRACGAGDNHARREALVGFDVLLNFLDAFAGLFVVNYFSRLGSALDNVTRASTGAAEGIAVTFRGADRRRG